MYCRDSNFDIPTVLDQVIDEPRASLKRRLSSKEHKDFVTQTFNGKRVKMDSLRYQVFKQSIRCACCGLEATHFGLEAFKVDVPNNIYHFNLYGMVDGKEIMFTKDHIHPKSKGGEDVIDNMQTMCSACNTEKGDKTT